VWGYGWSYRVAGSETGHSMSKLLPCPFCGKAADIEDDDTLYPNGGAWKFNDALQMRTYHRHREAPKEQWCWSMHCPEVAGGCGAEVSGDSKDEAIAKWNRRATTPQGD